MANSIKNPKKDKTFGLIVGAIGFGLTVYLFFQSHSFNPLPVGIGLVFLFIALTIPGLLFPIRMVLEKTGHYLGFINTYLLLTIIYVLLFIPLGFSHKIIGKDNLNLKKNTKSKSYWLEKQKQRKSSMKYQF
jgi:hypothetical protein